MNRGDYGITNPILGNRLQFNDSTQYVAALLKTAVTLVFVVGTTVFVFMFLIGGIKWITSAGDKAQAESARGTITNALVGLVLLLATFAITSLIEIIFSIDILQIDLTTLFING